MISKDLLLTLVPPKPLIIQAGGHKGTVILKLSSWWPDAQIHTFEPVPHLFEELKRNTAHNPRIHCYNKALSNVTGQAPMFISTTTPDTLSSLLKPFEVAKRSNSTFASLAVPTIRLDDWASSHAITHIDFLWLDVQGSEYAALQGAEHLLKNTLLIKVEVVTTERYIHNPHYDDIIQLLDEKGFKLIAEHLHHTTWGDALFLNTILPNSSTKCNYS